jgi:nucleotide-binding universal stress UspA family protein
MRRILIASDFSTAKAFATAIALAKATRADMTIMHVLVPFTPIVPEQNIRGATLDQLTADVRRWGQQQLDKLAAKAKHSGIRAGSLTMTGDPAQHIVRAARSKRADLIVLGTHDRTG